MLVLIPLRWRGGAQRRGGCPYSPPLEGCRRRRRGGSALVLALHSFYCVFSPRLRRGKHGCYGVPPQAAGWFGPCPCPALILLCFSPRLRRGKHGCYGVPPQAAGWFDLDLALLRPSIKPGQFICPGFLLRINISVPRESSRPSKSKSARRQGRPPTRSGRRSGGPALRPAPTGSAW